MKVNSQGWSVLVDVSGPVVPGVGLPNPPPYTTCTWTVTVSEASAPVPLSVADFETVDHLGQAYHLGLVPGRPVPPAVVRPGQTVSFQVRAFELVGEGRMRWAPDGAHAAAIWDYQVEND